MRIPGHAFAPALEKLAHSVSSLRGIVMPAAAALLDTGAYTLRKKG